MVKFVLPLAASAIFILVAAFTLLSGREAVAESSELSLFPMMPLPGETIAVLYRPTAKFSQDEHLILRAEVAFRDSIETRQVEIGHIFRVGDEFRGQFEFPSAADFAAIGIASADGQRLDLDNREWLLVASNPSGQPTRTGLMGKVAFTRQWAGDIAEETLLMVTELYPDSAGGWSQLQQTEAYFSSQTERDSINERHRTILHRLDRRLADQPLSASQIADMVFYARGLDDQIRDRWFDRLLREYPNAPPTSWHKVFEARDRLRDDPGIAYYV